MNDLHSRVLGAVHFVGGLGGGVIEGVMSRAGHDVPVRIEIDYPAQLDQNEIETIDVVLENFGPVEVIGHDVIRTGLRQEGSSAWALREAWLETAGADPENPESFLAKLRPIRILMTPDGGRVNPERMRVTFAVASSPELGEASVRYVRHSGAELVRDSSRRLG